MRGYTPANEDAESGPAAPDAECACTGEKVNGLCGAVLFAAPFLGEGLKGWRLGEGVGGAAGLDLRVFEVAGGTRAGRDEEGG